MARKPKSLPVPASDIERISEEERRIIQERASQTVAEERKQAALKQLMEQALEAERRRGTVDEEECDVTIDLPDFADRITVDGASYFHGYTYAVGYHQFQSMREQMARAWQHQDEIDGKSRFRKQPKGIVLGPGMENISASRLSETTNI